MFTNVNNKKLRNRVKEMNFMHDIVIIYGISIVLLGVLVSWYIKQYVLINAKNTRLAQFPQRNPNPILSVDRLGDIVFYNPASQQLWHQSNRVTVHICVLSCLS